MKKLEQKQHPLIKNIKKYVPLLILLLVFLKLSKAIFFIAIFTFITYQLKLIRGTFGLKMVVLDTLHFFALMIGTYIGLKEAVIFVFINTILIDFLTFIASEGTFVNFFLYSGSTVLPLMMIGKTNLLLAGVIGAFMYALTYYLYRTYIITNPFFEVIAKCVTSFLFTIMYIVFFGPLLKIVMSI